MSKKICIAGNFDLAVKATEFLIKNYKEYKIFIVLNKSDNGIDSFQHSFKKFSINKNLKIIRLEEAYSEKNLIFISLHFDRVIKTKKFISKKIYNIHFSLLPAYKGMHTAAMPILKGEKFSGVTLHKIDNGIDTGDVIAKKKFYIGSDNNAKDLFLKYIHYGFLLFKKNIDSLLKENFILTPQSSDQSSYYDKKSINFSKIIINLNKTAFEIHNQIRAYSFEDYQFPKIYKYFIYKSKISKIKSKLKPGSILYNKSKYLQISTRDYDMLLFKAINKL